MAGAFIDALAQPEAEDLHAAGRRAFYGAGVTLFHHGDDAGSVIVLMAGRAKVASLSSAGREVIVAVRGPGDLVGELSAIDDEPRSATVTMLEPVEALSCPSASAHPGTRGSR
jgi:CRP/FNR family transcriptional regulator, cyclic AMP receptor protein